MRKQGHVLVSLWICRRQNMSRKSWLAVVVSARTNVTNKEVKDNMPYLVNKSGSALASFLNYNGIAPAEFEILERSFSNGSVHYYMTIFTHRKPGQMAPNPRFTVLPSG